MIPADSLEKLGLTRKEAALYMALLELGESSVALLAKKTGIKRPTAYLILETLEEKGMANTVKKGKKKFFVAQHPKKIQIETELRLEELKHAMPQLESLFNQTEKKPRVLIYEGKQNIDKAVDDWFIEGGEVAYIGNFSLAKDIFGRTYRKAEYAPLGPAMHTREIIVEEPEGVRYAEKVAGEYRKIKFLPLQFNPFDADIAIYGNRVLITSVKQEYFTVSIESKEITQAFRYLFEAIWQMSKEVNPAMGDGMEPQHPKAV